MASPHLISWTTRLMVEPLGPLSNKFLPESEERQHCIHGRVRLGKGRRGGRGNRSTGASIYYLPRYSPNLNPIAQSLPTEKQIYGKQLLLACAILTEPP